MGWDLGGICGDLTLSVYYLYYLNLNFPVKMYNENLKKCAFILEKTVAWVPGFFTWAVR